MINSIEIENFKCIEKSGRLDIRPITLLMGPNSSGKSSVIKPFLMIKQTADSRDVQKSVQAEGAYVSLGSYDDFVFKHDKRRKVTFSFSFKSDGTIPWRVVRERERGYRPFISNIQSQSIDINVTLKSGTQEQIINERTVYEFNSGLGTITVAKVRGERGVYSGVIVHGDDNMKFTPSRRSKFYDVTQAPKARMFIPIYRSELGYNMPRLLSFLTNQFELFASHIHYIGPLREEPSILYSGVVERPQDVGTSGEDAAAVLWMGKSEKKQIELRKRVELWMKTFEISSSLRLKKLGPFFQVMLTDWYTGVRSNLTEVGFGASQLLPLIVEGYYAPEKSLIIAEQPEIHLHPKAQTLLADLLIDISKQEKNMLIETHSEHLLQRIQRRIAEGTIDKGDVALHYCEPTPEGSYIRRIDIDDYGQLSENLPEGFFEESFLETKEHLKAIVNRKNIEKSKE